MSLRRRRPEPSARITGAALPLLAQRRQGLDSHAIARRRCIVTPASGQPPGAEAEPAPAIVPSHPFARAPFTTGGEREPLEVMMGLAFLAHLGGWTI